MNNARWGTDYLNRTGTAKSNIYDNLPEETKYIYTDDDSQGQQLEGQDTYAIPSPRGSCRRSKGSGHSPYITPSLSSMTTRCSGSRWARKNKNLSYNADGSLTLYAGAKSPGKDKENNWLPAPDGTFSLYIRAYWPENPILDGTWTPPPYREVVN